MAKDKESRSAGDEEWLRAILASVPESERWVLELYGRKHVASLGRRIEQADYRARGVMHRITRETWDSYWASAPSNKAADFNNMDGNMFKALRKVVQVEEDGQKVSRVLTTEVLDTFRELLNVVIDTGMVYKSWAPEVLVTLPKVEGSSN